ncbi:RNA polymerase sigma factor [bacterium]|nr:RNA polymerase sigma factor [bacterium]
MNQRKSALHYSPTSDSDETLARNFQQGELSAFDELMERYMQQALSVAYYYLRNWEDAKDASQEAFVKLYQSISSFNSTLRFRPWFFRILINHCLNVKRKKKKIQFFSLFAFNDQNKQSALLDVLDDGSFDSERDEVREIVWKALDKLSGKHREVVVLHDMEGFKEDEIAEILNCSQGTVKSRLHYGRRKLRTLLSSYLK